MRKHLFNKTLLVVFLCIGTANLLYANSIQSDSLQIQVKYHRLSKSIKLRWAVPNANIWKTTNGTGFKIERFTIERGGNVLKTPERILLKESFKALPLAAWEEKVKTNNYAAIVAQALYGEGFELAPNANGAQYLMSESKELQQRYLISMYAADLDFSVAEMAAWGFEDTTITENEEYLYRIYCADSTQLGSIHYGICVTSGATAELPQPTYFNASFHDKSVLLSWDITHLRSHYVAYQVERSIDSIHFEPRFTPLVMNMAGKDMIIIPDSLEENYTPYYYRLYGVTPFGEKGPYSQTIKGEGYIPLTTLPTITSYETDSNGTLNLEWQFDSIAQNQIKCFELRRSISSTSGFTSIIKDIAPETRKVVVKNLLPSNYFVIAAIPHKGHETASLPILIQTVDSIPPIAPTGLHGIIDSTGIVTLTWNANTEEDIYGYRVFKRLSNSGKLFKMNDVAITSTHFRDSISLNDLNNYVYYAVAAIDKRYNQSTLSDTIQLVKPDIIPPTSPAIVSYKATEKGNLLKWISSSSTDAQQTLIYRSTMSDTLLFELCQSVALDKQEWLDTQTQYGVKYYYALKTVDTSNNQSDFSPTIVMQCKTKNKNSVKLNIDHLPQGRLLTWNFSSDNVNGTVEIYRLTSDGTFRLWKTLDAAERSTADTDKSSGFEYVYYIRFRPFKGYPIFSEKVK